jgi:putative RecB family exonuclease
MLTLISPAKSLDPAPRPEIAGTTTPDFLDEAEQLVRRYFHLEDPTTIHPIGLELKLEVQLDTLRLRGIIDRLELDDRGRFVVTDYKTGRVPRENQERSKLGGVHFYAFLLEQILGERPARVQLLYLSEPVTITTIPTEQSVRGLERKVLAVWSAIERACELDNFKPKPSGLCNWCDFQALCPAYGGDPGEVERFRHDAAVRAVPVPLASTG